MTVLFTVDDVKGLIKNIIDFIERNGESGLDELYIQLRGLYDGLEKGGEFYCYFDEEELKLKDFLKTWIVIPVHHKCIEELEEKMDRGE